MATFLQTVRPTPWSFYDADAQFQTDADSMVVYVKRMLGDDILTVELTKKQIWECFEDATTEWGSIINQIQLESQFASMLGMPTGSAENVASLYLRQNVEFLQRQAEPYAGVLGIGGSQNTLSGSISLTAGKMDYDFYTDLKDQAGVPLNNQQVSGSIGKIRILDVYHEAPSIYMNNSNLMSNRQSAGFMAESFIADTRFYVLPLFEDVLRGTQLKTAQKIRRSHYSYEIHGTKIRIYPMPAETTYTQKLWMRIMFNPDPTNPDFVDETIHGVSNVGNAPADNPIYSNVNSYGKNWIKKYCLALSKMLLGRVRGKIKDIQMPGGSNITLDGDDLRTEGKDEKEKLVTEVKEFLKEMTYDKIMERESTKAENLQKQLRYVPMPPKYIIMRG